LFEAGLDLKYGSLSGLLLYPETLDLLLDLLEVVLLSIHELLDIVVLLLDLTELSGHLPDLVLVVLHRRRIVRRLQQRVLLHELARTVVQPNNKPF
jgi:hypothetical protein